MVFFCYVDEKCARGLPIFLIVIPMKAVAKGRPRLGSFGHVYTPPATRKAESAIKAYLRGSHPVLLTGPLSLSVTIQFKKPKSAKKRDYPAVRPDLDNLVKLISDAANGILWIDDAQICTIYATKTYGPSDSLTISVSSLEKPVPCQP